MERYTGVLGLLAVLLHLLPDGPRIAKRIQPRVLFWGLGLQFGFAFFWFFARLSPSRFMRP